MRKTQVNLSIDPEVIDLAQRKFPKQVSNMVEEFLRNCLDLDIPEIKEKEGKIEKMKKKIDEIYESISREKIKLQAMQAQYKKLLLKEKKKKKEEMKARIKLHRGLEATGEKAQWGI